MSRKNRKDIELTPEAYDALTGIMLSDGHIQLRSSTSNGRLHFSQSGKPEKAEYFNLVWSLFKCYCTVNLKPAVATFSTKGKEYTRISFTTMQLPCFTVLRHLWYNSEGIKVVPENIEQLLTGVALAHWIMGDGSRQNKGLHLSVYNFSQKDVTLLRDAILTNFKVTTTIHSTVTGPRIYVSAAQMPLIHRAVLPYMVPSMYYKLGI